MGCHSHFRSKTTRFHRQMIELDSLEAYDAILLPNAVFHNDEDVDNDLESNRLQFTWTAISNIFYGDVLGISKKIAAMICATPIKV
jgi:hypothetical protein